jgi:hypothetical protein
MRAIAAGGTHDWPAEREKVATNSFAEEAVPPPATLYRFTEATEFDVLVTDIFAICAIVPTGTV